VFLSEHRGCPAHGLIQQTGQHPAMRRIQVAVHMARQLQSRLDRVPLYEKSGPNPAAIFIAAQKASGGMGHVLSIF